MASILTEPDHCQQSIGAITAVSVTGGTAPFVYSVDNINYGNVNKIRGLSEGLYNMYVKDANNCLLVGGDYLVGAFPSPVSMRVTTKHAICGSITGSVVVDSIKGGAAPYRFRINQQPLTTATTINNISPGSHLMRLVDNYGCELDQAFEIKYVSSPEIRLSPADTLVCYNQPVTWQLSSTESLVSSPSWNIPSTGYFATSKASENKQIIVTIRDRNNCIISDTAMLKVKACNLPENCLAVPNAFSPNADRKNDEIGPILNGCLLREFRFRIYNRYGQVVFESSDPAIKWNGKLNGITQPTGTYVYTCEYSGDDEVKRNLKGNFTLIR